MELTREQLFSDIRTDHAKRISELDLDGYAIGGLAVGETHEQMYQIIEETVPYLPEKQADVSDGRGNTCQYSRRG